MSEKKETTVRPMPKPEQNPDWIKKGYDPVPTPVQPPPPKPKK